MKNLRLLAFVQITLVMFLIRAFADERVSTVAYDPSTVVTVNGQESFQSSILFNSDEKIENIAVGDSLGWQVTPNKRANVLFLKPVARNAKTNMTVVTDKRVYLFDLQPARPSHAALYSLRFTYAEAAPSAAAPVPAPVATDVAVAPALAERAAHLNFGWRKSGSSALFPDHVFDDGQAVYLDWKQDTSVPAILAVGPDGSEGPVNFRLRGDVIVVNDPPPQLVLRLGKDAATLTNLAANDSPRKISTRRSTEEESR